MIPLVGQNYTAFNASGAHFMRLIREIWAGEEKLRAVEASCPTDIINEIQLQKPLRVAARKIHGDIGSGLFLITPG
jgi:hypothetical protein